jgi:PAS domain S-box-containing protein
MRQELAVFGEQELGSMQRDVNEQLVLSALRAQEEKDWAEKVAHEARASEDFLRSFADMIPILAWHADPDGAIRWHNRRWFEYTGMTLDEQDGWKWLSVLDPNDMPRVVMKWKAAVTTGEPWEDEFRIRRHDGQFRWLLSRAMAMRDSRGRIVRWFGTNVDIDDRRRDAEERSLSLVSERSARHEAEASNRMKDEFLATMSHELRTPLTAILGWSSLLRRGTYDKKGVERALAIIERNARAQARLIEDLLDVSRIISGKLKLELCQVDMNSIARAALDVVRPAADAKGVQLVVEVAPEGDQPKLVGDPDRLQQVVWNLLSNAVKFTPTGGTVFLRIERIDKTTSLVVRDTGLGIRREHLPFIFEPFRQVDSSTTRRFGGLGLGLAIVRHFVEMHGGSVSVESAGLGLGTTFTIALPTRALKEEDAPPPSQPPTSLAGAKVLVVDDDVSAKKRSKSAKKLAGAKVLVVDDDGETTLMIKDALELVGASVEIADCARAAFDFIVTHAVDVIVSDIGMPGEDGFSLMRRVRALPADRGGRVPALALTPYARNEDALRAYQVGYQCHLAKPADIDELARSVAKLVSRQAPAPII